MITASLLRTVCPACKQPEDWALHLAPALKRFEITTPDRVAAFLAQIAHESNELNCVLENLSYSAERLMAVWPRRFPDIETARKYARNSIRLANYVYGGRLGNNTFGEGFKYRGRGLIQVTGKDNYRAAELGTGIPFVEHPERMETKHGAAMSAAWYWSSRNLNALADDTPTDDQAADFVTITQAINGGRRGLADRRRYWIKACEALGVKHEA